MIETFKLVVKLVDQSQTLGEFKGKQFTSDAQGLIALSFDGVTKRTVNLDKSKLYFLEVYSLIDNSKLMSSLAIYKGYDFVVTTQLVYNPDGSIKKDLKGNDVYETITYANHINFMEV